MDGATTGSGSPPADRSAETPPVPAWFPACEGVIAALGSVGTFTDMTCCSELTETGFEHQGCCRCSHHGVSDALVSASELGPVRPVSAMSPTSRKMDRSFRIQLRIGGTDIGELLGWEVGPLRSSMDGPWLLLERGGPGDRCALVEPGRVRFDASARWRLTVGVGDDVLVLPIPDRRALAVCNPRLVLSHVPLSTLEAAGVQ